MKGRNMAIAETPRDPGGIEPEADEELERARKAVLEAQARRMPGGNTTKPGPSGPATSGH